MVVAAVLKATVNNAFVSVVLVGVVVVVLQACAEGCLDSVDVKWKEDSRAVTVVMASQGNEVFLYVFFILM